MHKLALLGATALSSLALTAGAQAANATGVSEVVVTQHLEEAQPAALAQTGVRVDVITQDQIRNSGFVDITEALQNLAPGLTIISKSGPFDYVDISFQGSRTQDVLWLVDGVRINNRLYASTTPLDTVPSAMVDRIEVLNGGQSLFYGTQGTAAAINIATRAFTDTQKGRITLTGEDAAGIPGVHTDGFYSNRYGAHQIVLFASGDYTKGQPAYRNYQPSSTDRNRGYQVVQEGLKYAWSPSDATRLSLMALHTDGFLDFPQAYKDYHIANNRHEDLDTVKLDKDLSQQVSVYLKGYYHAWHTVFTSQTNTVPVGGPITSNTEPWGYEDEGLNALARFRLNKGFEYYLGYDLQRYSGSDSELIIAPNSGVAHGVFGQVRTTPDLIKNGDFAAGFRWTGGNQAGTYPDTKGNPAPVSGHNSNLVWNVSGQYNFGAALFMRGTLGTNFRLPTAEELYANDPDDEHGNVLLKPESSRGVNLSVGGSIGPATWEATGFARDTDNLISCSGKTADGAQCLFINISKVMTRGGEFSVKGSIVPGLTGMGSYTYANTVSPGSDVQVARIPRQSAKASLNWTPLDARWGAIVSATWTGETIAPVTVSSSAKTKLLLPNGTIATATFNDNYGGFAIFNAGVHYDFGADRTLRVNLAVNNIADTRFGRPSSGNLDTPVTSGGFTATKYLVLPYGNPRTFRVSVSKSF